MNKLELSLKRKHLRHENHLQTVALSEVPRDKWPSGGVTSNPARVLRSKEFLMLEYAPDKGAIRLTVCRTELNGEGMYLDNISWDDLQRLKREAGYGDRHAVEIYPADKDIVSVANMRHLFVLDAPMPFAWRAKESPFPS